MSISPDTLPLAAPRDDRFLAELEGASRDIFHRLKAADVHGPWSHSPVEERFLRIREALLDSPGTLRAFRRSFLAAGRLTFPDSPFPKEHFLTWDDRLAGQRLAGALRLLKEVFLLWRAERCRLAELEDNRIGSPTTFQVPATVLGAVALALRRFGVRLPEPRCYHITEVQVRMAHYRRRLEALVPGPLSRVCEVGGGYGALAAELLRSRPIGQYLFVELPETVPLAYFYLRASFDCAVQVLYSPDDDIDPSARIVIMPPWKLPDVSGQLSLFINTMSLQHMWPESVAFYLKQADRLEAVHLYLVNRDTKRDPTDLAISQYPFSPAYAVASRGSWLFGPHVELLMRRQG